MKKATKTNNGRVGQLVAQEALNLPSSELVGSNPTAFTIQAQLKLVELNQVFNFLLGVLIGTVFGATIKTYAGSIYRWAQTKFNK